MKNIYKKLTFLFIIVSFFAFSGCDELSELTVNVPLEIVFNTSGNSDSPSNPEYFCLSQYDAWQENQDDVNSVKFLKASYWTVSASSNLTADLQFTLSRDDGTTIFTVTMNNVVAADYLENAYELELSGSEIEALNSYLALMTSGDECFNSNLSVTNIDGTLPFQLEGKVEIVLETEVSTD
jgi:hypothetical protein